MVISLDMESPSLGEQPCGAIEPTNDKGEAYATYKSGKSSDSHMKNFETSRKMTKIESNKTGVSKLRFPMRIS